VPDTKFNFFLQQNTYTGLNYRVRSQEVVFYGREDTHSFRDGNFYVGTSIIPGVTYFATPHLGIEATIGKLSYNFDDFSTHMIDLNLNTISLGLRYSFVKK
jgi:hypothetical protein